MTLKGLSPSPGSSWSKNWARSPAFADGFFTVWATRSTQRAICIPSKLCVGLVTLARPNDIVASLWWNRGQIPLSWRAQHFCDSLLSPKSRDLFSTGAADTWEEDGLQGSWRYRHYQNPDRKRAQAGTGIGDRNWYSDAGQGWTTLSCGLLHNTQEQLLFAAALAVLAAKTVLIWKSIPLFGLTDCLQLKYFQHPNILKNLRFCLWLLLL